MEISDFIKILEIVLSTTAWPLFFVFLFVSLKKNILLISKIKFQDVELDFQKALQDIEKERKNIKSDSVEITKTSSLKPNMLSLAEKSPYSVIIQAFSISQDEIIKVAKKVEENIYNNEISALQFLVDKGLLNNQLFDVYLRAYAVKERLIYTEERTNSKELSIELSDTIMSILRDIKEEVGKNSLKKINLTTGST